MNLNMLKAASSIDVSSTGAFSSERFALAGEMTVLGMLMIFSVLAILWIILTVFSKIMTRKTETPQSTAVESVAPIITPTVENNNDDGTVAAVIAAAVAAYMSSEDCSERAEGNGFRVISFRRVQGGKAWNSKN